MKRFLISVIALFLIFSVQASAQVKFGATGGMNFNTSKFTELDVKAKTGWNAGLTLLVDLPLGFSVQPSLLYSQKNANLVEGVSQNMGYLELPVSVQWGPDLLILRPFLDVTPYVGYAITNKTQMSADFGSLVGTIKGNEWEGKQRFEYGLGIGGGINVWKLQVVARYCWNFGSLYNVESWNDIKDHLNKDELSAGSENFGGLMLNLAFFF